MRYEDLHHVHKINCKKADLSKFIPMDMHTVIDVHEIDPTDCCISRIDSHIVKIDKRTGRIKKHLNHNTIHVK